MAVITAVRAREIYDSRGKPTVEAEIEVDGRQRVRASVPSGASVGQYEAHELRDAAGPGPVSVRTAVRNVCTDIRTAIVGSDVRAQDELDALLCRLDGTSNKAKLGANAILAVSLTLCRASAVVEGVPLYRRIADLAGTVPAIPVPMVNMISGGMHGGGNLDLQDWLVVPRTPKKFRDTLHRVVELYWQLGTALVERGFSRSVGDEGGYAPALSSNEAAFELICAAAQRNETPMGESFDFALDVAATHLLHDGVYVLRSDDQRLDSDGLLDRLGTWTRSYPISSLEDLLGEDDWNGWRRASHRFRGLQIIGDDLFTTNPDRLERGIREECANAVLIKMNQIGTVSETLSVVALARSAGYLVVASARSGETEDDFLADFGVGIAADQIKIGSVARSERLAKYNRLLRIAEELEG